MGKNIVICSDGTGNTFDKGVSNVTRLIKHLALDDSQEQIVVYDQGIGTNSQRLAAVNTCQSIPDKDSLVLLDGPKQWRFHPAGWTARLIGLVGGYGIRANVREMYQKLSQVYEGPAFCWHLGYGQIIRRHMADHTTAPTPQSACEESSPCFSAE